MAPKAKIKFDPQDLIDDQLEAIDEALAEIERRMKPYERLNEKKQQLLAARRALLGVNRLTGGTSARLHLEEILDYLKDHPGSTPAQIAEHFGTSQPTVSSHIYRNKLRFINKDGRYWVRDPKEGLETADDIED